MYYTLLKLSAFLVASLAIKVPVFSVNLVCKKELNLMLKVSETSGQGAVGFELRGTDFFLPILYDLNNKGERVKIPLLPNKVGKRSGTMTMVTTEPVLTGFISLSDLRQRYLHLYVLQLLLEGTGTPSTRSSSQKYSNDHFHA